VWRESSWISVILPVTLSAARGAAGAVGVVGEAGVGLTRFDGQGRCEVVRLLFGGDREGGFVLCGAEIAEGGVASAGMTAVDHRGLTPLFWTRVARYGEVRLNMDRRLSLRAEA
jgi:hypothetical protein